MTEKMRDVLVNFEMKHQDNILKILSQNMRCVDDGVDNTIVKRAQRFKRLIVDYSPDLIGTQEISKKWYEAFEEMISADYGIIGRSRLGNNTPISMNSDESNLILYKLSRFTLINSNTFWLSDTINEVSKYFESNYHRICTYALLFDKQTNKEILFFNTHLAHEEDDEGRQKQAKVLMKFIKETIDQNPNVLVYLTGDFNTTNSSESYKIVNKEMFDSFYTVEHNLATVDYTYHEYGNERVYKIIDYCFYYGESNYPLYYYIINDDYNGYVSDHFGVLVGYILNK